MKEVRKRRRRRTRKEIPDRSGKFELVKRTVSLVNTQTKKLQPNQQGSPQKSKRPGRKPSCAGFQHSSIDHQHVSRQGKTQLVSRTAFASTRATRLSSINSTWPSSRVRSWPPDRDCRLNDRSVWPSQPASAHLSCSEQRFRIKRRSKRAAVHWRNLVLVACHF